MVSLFLFLSNLFGHTLAWIGGILTLIGIIEKFTNKALIIRRSLIWWSAGGLLLIASFQAWLDEHHNVTTLIYEGL